MQGQLNIALRAARDGAASLVRQLDRLDRVKVLEDRSGRAITSAHQEVEQILFQSLHKTFPGHEYHSSVSGRLDNGSSHTAWLLDPLIGEQNFLRGAPGVLLGLSCRVEGQIKLAVLIDPLLNEEYTAMRGDGARLNGRRLRVSPGTSLDAAIVGVELAQGNDGDQALTVFQQLLSAGAAIRSYGSPILTMLYCAAGRLDGGLIDRPDSIALSAAALILRESGGLLSDTRGDPALAGEFLAFGNTKMFKQLLKLAS